MRWLAFVILFFADVHVRAESAECWGQRVPCAVQSLDSRRILKMKDTVLTLRAGSLLEQRDAKTIELIDGLFYVETTKPVVWQTPYARVWCEGECKGLFQRTLTTLEVTGLGGRWQLQRTGEKQIYGLAAGLRMELGEVTDEGRASMDFPQSLPWTPTIRAWAQMYPRPLTGLKVDLEKFRPIWRAAGRRRQRPPSRNRDPHHRVLRARASRRPRQHPCQRARRCRTPRLV